MHANKIHLSHILILFSSIFLIISCASTQKNQIPEPEWITNKKAVFPDAAYLAQLGTGITAQEARNNSIAQLASYFNTNVKSLVEGETFTYNSSNDLTKVERTIKSSTVTSTDLELFALETEEPYFLKRENKWYCCAHINRKDAWNQYEPVVRDNKNSFYSIFGLVAKTTDPLERIKIYNQTEAASEVFLGSLYKATMFSKTLTDKAFGEDREVIASIPGLVQNEKNNCVMCIKTKGDFGGTLSSTVNSIFSRLGFTTSDNAEKSNYIVESEVLYNEVKEDDLFVYTPSVKLSVKSQNKTLYVYENKLDRILSYNETKAKKNVCDGIADLLEKELATDFSSIIGLNK